VLDKEGDILNEYYESIFTSNKDAHTFFRKIEEAGKIVRREKASLDVVNVILSYADFEYFDPSDIKFLQVAVNAPGSEREPTIIVSKDSRSFIELRKRLDEKIPRVPPPYIIRRFKIITPKEAVESGLARIAPPRPF